MIKKITSIVLLLGGILLMTNLAACSDHSTARPKNRSEEEVQVEKAFQPLFAFLNQKEKDFSAVNTYVASITYEDKKNNQREEKSIVFNPLDLKAPKGTFSHIIQDTESKEEIAFEASQNKLNLKKTKAEDLDFILNRSIETEAIKKLGIVTSSKDHPETELKTILYDKAPESDLVDALMEQYDIKDIKKSHLSLSENGKGNYKVQVSLRTNEKVYYMDLLIEMKAK